MRKIIKLLIIDDDRDDYTVIRDLLAGVHHRRYDVDWAPSANHALDLMHRKAYDVCLVDFYLTGTTAVEFIQLASQRGIGVPVIVLTGQDDETAELASQKAGAVEFLPKDDLTWRLLDRSIRYVIETADTVAQLRDANRFPQSILDSISTQIAIISESGKIDSVNRAWTDSAAANGMADQDWNGVDYLAVCDKAAAGGDETAAEIAQAIRDVLDLRWTSFAAEYPCHSAGEQRWFRVSITRFQHLQSCWAVVVHDNITDRKLAEELARGAGSVPICVDASNFLVERYAANAPR
jgi:CheY-like chemotaxis protein